MKTSGNNLKSAADLGPDDIAIGGRHEFTVGVTDEAVALFASLSGDYNPLHCELDYAKGAGFGGKVAHGAYQIALVSQAVGMWVIGKRCLIGEMNARFLRPLVYPVDIRVSSLIKTWSAKTCTGEVEVTISDEKGAVNFSVTQVKVSLQAAHPTPLKGTDLQPTQSANSATAKKCLLITGASGGLGQRLAVALAGEYELILCSRRELNFEGVPHESVIHDLSDADGFVNAVESALKGRPLWGIVHAAAHAPEKSLLECGRQEFAAEINLAAYMPVVLGRLLRDRANEGGRLVLIGSNGSLNNAPVPEQLRYAVMKSFAGVVGRGLAFELARHRITVNIVSPDFMPLGMNAAVNPRYAQMKAAANPQKRLCDVEDVATAVAYFLNERSGFVSGQEIVLDGGML